MQKITPHQYAIFLYEITSKKTESEAEKATGNFLAILAKNNDLGKLNKIIKEFEVYDKKQRGIKDVEIISARPLSKDAKKQILTLAGNGASLEVKESVDTDLIGGLTLIVEDRMIDGSLRRKLAELKKVLS